VPRRAESPGVASADADNAARADVGAGARTAPPSSSTTSGASSRRRAGGAASTAAGGGGTGAAAAGGGTGAAAAGGGTGAEAAGGGTAASAGAAGVVIAPRSSRRLAMGDLAGGAESSPSTPRFLSVNVRARFASGAASS